jgi:hypothetical protein
MSRVDGQTVVAHLVAVAHDLFGLDVAVVTGLAQAFEWACDKLGPVTFMANDVVHHGRANGAAFWEAALAQRMMCKLVEPYLLPLRRFVELAPRLGFSALGVVPAPAVGDVAGHHRRKEKINAPADGVLRECGTGRLIRRVRLP